MYRMCTYKGYVEIWQGPREIWERTLLGHRAGR